MPLTARDQAGPSNRTAGVLVTGAAGFIGARIVRALLIEGFHVTAMVRSQDSERIDRLREFLSRGAAAPLRLITCDIHDRHALDRAIDDPAPARCVHAAWNVSHEGYRSDGLNQQWVKSSLHLFELLRRRGCQWLSVLGTCAEPSGQERPPCRYSAAKFTLHNRLFESIQHDSKSNSMRAFWLRIFQPYGPGEPQRRFIPSCIAANLNREPFSINEPDAVRDFIHVDDIASAVLSAMARRVHGIFDVGTGAGHRIGDVARFIAELVNDPAGASATDLAAFAPEQPGAPVANHHSLMSCCGWAPTIDLRSGLQQLIDEHRQHRRVAA